MIRRIILVLAGLFGLAGVVIVHGTYPGPTALVMARVFSGLALLFFLAEQIVFWLQSSSFGVYFRKRWPTFLLSVMLILESLGLLLGRESAWLNGVLGRFSAGSLTHAYLLIIQVYIVALFAIELPHLHRRFARLRIRPAVAFVLVFAALVVVGTGFLMLPRSTPAGQPITWLDSFFTATSAVCVTGLVVRDTGSQFTVFGQTVILVLIQLGGLGIMSLAASLGLLLGRGIGVRESSLLREVFQVPMMAEVGRMVRTIIFLTLALESLGAVLLYQSFDDVGLETGPRIFSAVFHSVSAFCNAGFSLFNDSLVSVADNPLAMGTISTLLVIGGLGFGVIVQLAAWFRGRTLRMTRGSRVGTVVRLNLNARVVLSVSIGLLLGGWLLLAALEWDASLAGLPWHLKLSQAFFQGATCRTAGFNSMDLTSLAPASIFFMVILMFIGGAPGGTAGGIKVTAVAIVWANVKSIGSGLARVRLGNREIEPVQVHRSMLVLTSFLVLAAVGVFILLITEKQPLPETVFEVFSALGTVGLSLGMTTWLSPVGKIVIAVLMFAGRLGPLTLAGSLVAEAREPRVRLPRGRILIG